jgi:hypothetical protein
MLTAPLSGSLRRAEPHELSNVDPTAAAARIPAGIPHGRTIFQSTPVPRTGFGPLCDMVMTPKSTT